MKDIVISNVDFTYTGIFVHKFKIIALKREKRLCVFKSEQKPFHYIIVKKLYQRERERETCF